MSSIKPLGTRSIHAVLCLVTLLSFFGCVISPRRDVTTTSGGATNFSVSSSPTSQAVTAGGAANFTISVAPRNSFTGAVNLTVSNVPASMQASVSPNQVTGGTGSATLSVTTSTSTPLGSTTLTVTGTDANTGAFQTINVTVTVQ